MRFFHLFLRFFLRRLPDLWIGGVTIFLGTFFFTFLSGVLSSSENFLRSESSTIMGGDVKISYFQPITAENIPNLPSVLALPNIKISSQMGFSAMIRKNDTPLVVQAKVTDSAYPLLGAVKTIQKSYTPPKETEIWINTDVADRLSVQEGEKITFGNVDFTIVGIFTALPDVENTSALFGGSVLISEAGFLRSGIDRRTSRVDYVLTIVTPNTLVAENIKTMLLSGNIPKSIRIRLANEEGGRIFRTFQSAESFFFGFLGLLLTLFAGTLLLGIEHFFTKERRNIALLKAMGMPPSTILGGYFGMMGIWCLILGSIGSIFGYTFLLFLPHIIPQFAEVFTNTNSISQIFPGIGIAFLFFLIASIELLTPLLNLSPLSLLRAQNSEESHFEKLSILKFLQNKNNRKRLLFFCFKNGALVFLWFISCVLVFPTIWSALVFFGMGVGIFSISIIAFSFLQKWFSTLHWKTQKPFLFRILLSVFHRPQRGTRLVFLSLFLAFFALCSTGSFGKSIETELFSSQQVNAPTFILFDVSKDQVKGVDALIKKIEWYPIVRSYLEIWNDKNIRGDEENYPRAQRAFNVTSRLQISETEKIVKGTWWTEDSSSLVVSVEQNFAEEMGIQIGDTLTFDIQGQKIKTTVQNIRSVGEQKLSPWFIFVFPPKLLQDAPASYLGFSWENTDNLPSLESRIIKEFPSITTIKTKEISSQINTIITKVLLLIRVLTLFLMASAILSFIAMLFVNKETQKRIRWRFSRLGAKNSWISYFVTLETLFLTVFPFIIAFSISIITLFISSIFFSFVPPLVIDWIPLLVFGGCCVLFWIYTYFYYIIKKESQE